MTALARSTAHSIVEATPRAKAIAGTLVILYAVISILPLLWIAATAFKSQSDAIAYPPKVIFQPTLEGYVNLFTVRTRQTPDFIAKLPPGAYAPSVYRRAGDGWIRCQGKQSLAAP